MSEITEKAEQTNDKKTPLGSDVDPDPYSRPQKSWDYDPEFGKFSPEERDHLLRVGVEPTDMEHAGTYVQADASVVHCQANIPGLEVLPITEAT